MSFYHISDNKTPYTNIKQNEDSQVRFLYLRAIIPTNPGPSIERKLQIME